MDNASKNSTNPRFNSKYANLTSVLDEIRPVFSKFDLTLFQSPDTQEGKPGVLSIVGHSSGEFLGGFLPLPEPSLSDPQKVTAAVTYYRRTMAVAHAAISQDDDDGNKTTNKEWTMDTQAGVSKVMGGEGGEYVIPFGKFVGKSIKDVPLPDLKKYLQYLEDVNRKEGKPIGKPVQDLALNIAKHEEAMWNHEVS